MPSSARYGGLPFAEQIRFFRQKVNVPTRAWTDIYAAMHDHGFMVAGATKSSLVLDFRAAIDKAISQGTTLEEFRRDFDAIVDRHGWGYKGGRNWRTRTIYETNLRTSYAAGREQQMADPDLRKRRPYGLYRHGGSEDPRPEHLALDGTVVPLDDPFWDEWSPPNGWGCSCKKFMVSQRDVDRLGLKVRDPGPRPPRETRTVGIRGPSPRTVDVPQGIDPGFEYRPGATLAGAANAWADKATAISAELGRQAVQAISGTPAFARWLRDPRGEVPVAVVARADADRMGSKTRVARLSEDTMRKQLENHPDLRTSDYLGIQNVIDRGKKGPGNRPGTLVYVEEVDQLVLVVKSTQIGDAIYITSFRRLPTNQARRDSEVRRLLGERES